MGRRPVCPRSARARSLQLAVRTPVRPGRRALRRLRFHGAHQGHSGRSERGPVAALSEWDTPGEIADSFKALGYLADEHTSQVVYLADKLQKPILAEGPAGVGKTELAVTIAKAADRRLVRLQCYEGLDEAKALYEWNYHKQLLRLQADEGKAWDDLEGDIFGEDFLLTRPLLEAITSEDPVVLLIDEVDRIEIETEALLLEVLDSFQVTIPELGTVTANSRPLVVLTSNNTRELSEALKRRCLFLHIDYPNVEREREILMARVPELSKTMADRIAKVVRSVRDLKLRKAPSVSESIDWARTLLALGADDVSAGVTQDTLGVLLKYQEDIERAAKELQLPDEE
ncbi:MAG: MoxR family ATPase [Acidimicrobiia bacterium]|nr:MoxR family ATPase [Acidimicrobiia bacterium]